MFVKYHDFLVILGTVLRDEDILNLLQDGNESDIEEFHDEGEEEFNSTIFRNILDGERPENPDTAPIEQESATTRAQLEPITPHLAASSSEVIFESASSRQSVSWKQTSFIDTIHDYPCPPSGVVKTPMEYVHDYFDEEFFESTAHCSNTYHLRKNGTELKTTPLEIKKLFGIHLVMGIIPYPRIPMYWRASVRLPLIAEHISRDRFLQLRNSLHVVDSDSPPPVNDNSPPNPLWKVQPMIDRVRNACYKLERAPGFYSIDEQIIPFTGRCALRQVVKNKPRTTGLKNFVTTTSDGLMVDFEIYKGAKTMFENTSLGLGPSVVLFLSKTIPSGSCVYHDRYFTTVPLVEEMMRRNLHSTGTIMMNRIPGRAALKFKKDCKMFRGESQQFVRDGVALVKWKDNKSVLMASNCTGAEQTDYVKRWDKQTKSYKNITAPKVITNYNSHMGGVDVLDQMMEYYRAFIKTKKWTLKVLIHFLDLAVVNAWRKYKIDCEANKVPRKNVLPLLDFRMEVADAYLSTPSRKRRLSEDESTEDDQPPVTKKYIPHRPSNAKRYDGYEHLPIFDQLSAPRSCRLETCKSRSKIRCIKCDVYLCLSRGKDCFRLYHTSSNT